MSDPVDPDASNPSDEDDLPSRTELKKQAEALQKLGLRLAELKASDLTQLGLPDNLLKGTLDYQRFPSREARRRQMQFVGKLMRKIDVAPIQQALDDLDGISQQARFVQHQAELWRDKLIAENAALTEFLNLYPDSERQALRQHIGKARKEQQQATQTGTPTTHQRALFRLLRNAIQAHA